MPDGYAEDTHDVAAGAQALTGGSGRVAVRVRKGKSGFVADHTTFRPRRAVSGFLPAVAPTVPLPVAFLT